MSKYIGLYADRALKVPIPQQDGAWYVNLGHLDAGQKKRFLLYLENQSMGTIEDLEISVESVSKRGVQIKLYDEKTDRLRLAGIHEFSIEWTVPEDVRAGKCRVGFIITGTVTDELDK